MKVTLRQARPQDAEICGKVCYEAFRSIGDQHNFLHDFPNTEAGVGLLTMMLSNPSTAW